MLVAMPSSGQGWVTLGEARTTNEDPEQVHLHGTVYLGDQPAKAVIDFRWNGELSREDNRVETGSNGRYSAHLTKTPNTAYVTLVADIGSRRRSWLMIPPLKVQKENQVNFHIPDNQFSVHVTDSVSGKAIHQAEVTYQGLRIEDGEEKGRSTYNLFTRADGRENLQRISPGPIQVFVVAEGYQPSEVRRLRVGEGPENRVLEFALVPEGTDP